MSENTIWVEKYRPTSLENYIGNPHIKEKIESCLNNNDVPSLLFYGDPGTGKSTICKIIVKALDCDFLWINASDENNVETIRNKVKNFASTMGFKTWKIVVLDEFDFVTPAAQAILRELIERHSANTRFLLTCNYIEKVIPAIQSRMQTYHVEPPSKKEVAIYVSNILDAEQIQYTPMDIKVVVDAHYSDIRKIIGECQRQVINGELKLDRKSLMESNYALKAIDILKSNKSAGSALTEIRQLFADSQVKDFTPLFQILYDKADEYSKGHTAEIILKLTEYEYQHQVRLIKEMSAASAIISILELIR